MTELYVHVDVDGKPISAGMAYFSVGRQRVTTSFVYEPGFLTHPQAHALGPSLPLQSGQLYVDGMPGIFADSAPDRWGRNLIDKKRRAAQRSADQRLPALTDVDYLTGVSDLTRQGNLRFSKPEGGPFLDPDHTVPKLVSLPKLLASTDQISQDGDDFAAVKALLDAGSGSLGGTRPKASVRGDDGRLLIAKFPHRHDEWNVIAWEKTALDLAERAGIRVPERRLTTVGSRHVLLLSRFDRSTTGARIGYMSAMTLLGATEGEDRDYLEVIEAIPEFGAHITGDLAELFRRIVLAVAIHNTDDHLRNHGFLRVPGGWTLSPTFDINPNPDLGKQRATSVAGAIEADAEAETLLEVATECRLSEMEARAIISDIVDTVSTWPEVATHNGVPVREQSLFGEVFTHQLATLRAVARY